MIFPIRCFTCNKPIADLWFKYNEMVLQFRNENKDENVDIQEHQILDTNYINNVSQNTESPEKKTLDVLGIERQCCRRHFLCHIDI